MTNTTPRLTSTLLLGALLAGGAGLAHAANAQEGALTSAKVEALLAEQGYRKVHDVTFKDGLWQAEAESGDGEDLKLRIDPVAGRIYGDRGASAMTEADVRAALAANGYSKVHDLKFKDGLWKAQAEQSSGQDIKVQVDPRDGLVVSAEND